MKLSDAGALHAVAMGYRGGTEEDQRPTSVEESARLIYAWEQSKRAVRAAQAADAYNTERGTPPSTEQAEATASLVSSHDNLNALALASRGYPIPMDDGGTWTPATYTRPGVKSKVLAKCKALIGA